MTAEKKAALAAAKKKAEEDARMMPPPAPPEDRASSGATESTGLAVDEAMEEDVSSVTADTASIRSSAPAVHVTGPLAARKGTMRGRFGKTMYNLPCRARDTRNREVV